MDNTTTVKPLELKMKVCTSHLDCFIANPMWWCTEANYKKCVIFPILTYLTVCSFCQCTADKTSHKVLLQTSSEDKVLLSWGATPKLLLPIKMTSSVASRDTLLNKQIKWFGCTSRYASHSAIYCSSPCYSLQTLTGWYLSSCQPACDTIAEKNLVCSHIL